MAIQYSKVGRRGCRSGDDQGEPEECRLRVLRLPRGEGRGAARRPGRRADGGRGDPSARGRGRYVQASEHNRLQPDRIPV